MHLTNKKLVLATTAFAGLAHLSAANVSAAEWNVSVGGFMEQWFGYGDSSVADAEGFDQQGDVEIHFKPTITFDNRIKVGVPRCRVRELCANADVSWRSERGRRVGLC